VLVCCFSLELFKAHPTASDHHSTTHYKTSASLFWPSTDLNPANDGFRPAARWGSSFGHQARFVTRSYDGPVGIQAKQQSLDADKLSFFALPRELRDKALGLLVRERPKFHMIADEGINFINFINSFTDSFTDFNQPSIGTSVYQAQPGLMQASRQAQNEYITPFFGHCTFDFAEFVSDSSGGNPGSTLIDNTPNQAHVLSLEGYHDSNHANISYYQFETIEGFCKAQSTHGVTVLDILPLIRKFEVINIRQ
jgi:hypothetical protein